jgi:maltose O-acetyltransferase
MTNKNYAAMIAGELYNATDPCFFDLKSKVSAAKAEFDKVSNDDVLARVEAGRRFFAEGSKSGFVLAPFTIQFGHVRLGEWSFVNYGATFLDANYITIGDYAAVGPNVQFITDTHPVRPEERFVPAEEGDVLPFRVINYALPITVGAYAWIGAGATIMPGVTIGDGAVVAAGAIVTRDVAPRTIVAGSPARFLRHVDD